MGLKASYGPLDAGHFAMFDHLRFLVFGNISLACVVQEPLSLV